MNIGIHSLNVIDAYDNLKHLTTGTLNLLEKLSALKEQYDYLSSRDNIDESELSRICNKYKNTLKEMKKSMEQDLAGITKDEKEGEILDVNLVL